jgi:phage-related tail protein
MKEDIKKTFDRAKKDYNNYSKEINKLISQVNKERMKNIDDTIHDTFQESKSFDEFSEKFIGIVKCK